MENFEMGAFLGGEWESLCKMFDPDFAAIGNGFLNDPSNSIPSNDQNNYFPEISFPNYDFPLKIPLSNENCHFDEFSHLATPNTDAFLLTNFGAIDGANDAFLASILSHDMINDAIPLNKDGSRCSEPGLSPTPISMEVPNKRKYSVPETEQKSGSLVMPKKKARFTRINKVEKSVQLKETETLSASENEDEGTTNAGSDDIAETASQETSEGEISTSKGKKRASRGEATDPQSLYARRRREKINERLRILQSLVPNGKKVDISTMLEEAVHYVKFLQLQIKLLSSDDLWMYAPIACNGVDISLYRGISPFLLP